MTTQDGPGAGGRAQEQQQANLEGHAVIRPRHRMAEAPERAQELVEVDELARVVIVATHELTRDDITQLEQAGQQEDHDDQAAQQRGDAGPDGQAAGESAGGAPGHGQLEHQEGCHHRRKDQRRNRVQHEQGAQRQAGPAGPPGPGRLPQRHERQQRPGEPGPGHELGQVGAHVDLHQVIRRVGKGQRRHHPGRRPPPAAGQAEGPQCPDHEAQRPDGLNGRREPQAEEMEDLADHVGQRGIDQPDGIAEPQRVVRRPDRPERAVTEGLIVFNQPEDGVMGVVGFEEIAGGRERQQGGQDQQQRQDQEPAARCMGGSPFYGPFSQDSFSQSRAPRPKRPPADQGRATSIPQK